LTGYEETFPHRTNSSEIWLRANSSGARYGSGQDSPAPSKIVCTVSSFFCKAIIIPHGRLPEVQSVLNDLNVGGMSHYEISGSGRIKVDPVVAATHPKEAPLGTAYPHPEYISRTKIEVVVKNEQVDKLLSGLRERLRGGQGGKIFVEDVRDAIDIPTFTRGEEVI
jgi:nitrogen regulatory protein P-II 1